MLLLVPNTRIKHEGSRKLAGNLPVVKLQTLMAIKKINAFKEINLDSVYEMHTQPPAQWAPGLTRG
jgi:hypothetical protein